MPPFGLGRGRRLTGILAVMALAPLAVAAGLLVFRSITVTFVLFHGGVCLLVPLLHMAVRREKPGAFLRGLGLVRTPDEAWPSLLWGLACFAVVFAFFALLRERIWNAGEVASVLSRWGVNRMDPFLFVSIMVIGNGFLEEFFWRGYIQRRLRGCLPPRKAEKLSSGFYASYHGVTTGVLFSLTWAAVSVVSIYFAGVIWSRVRVKTGSLVMPVVTHVFIDLAVMAAYLLYLR
jgi:uncharacterized protein